MKGGRRLSNQLILQCKCRDSDLSLVGLRTFFAVLNEHTEYANFAMFRQFLPLEDGLIFELVILDQY